MLIAHKGNCQLAGNRCVDSASCMKNTIGGRKTHSLSMGRWKVTKPHWLGKLDQLELIKCGKERSTQLPLSISQEFHVPTFFLVWPWYRNLAICSRGGTVELNNYPKFHQQKSSWFFLITQENNFYFCAHHLQYKFGIAHRSLSTMTA